MKKKWFLSLLCIFCVNIFTAESIDLAADTQTFIDEALRKLPSIESENAILLLGPTRSGKSNLVQYLTGDNSKLMAVKTESGDYTIRDGSNTEENTSVSSTLSQTVIPGIHIDENQTLWMDFPGFGDKHNETVEITKVFLIKHVIQRVKNVKFVLVVDYGWVSGTGNIVGFDNLLQRVTEFITNEAHYGNSISLVVSKVPFPTELETDDSFKVSIEEFAQKYLKNLPKKRANLKKRKLINYIFEDFELEDYSKVSAFRRPNAPGPLNENEDMITSRKAILDSIEYTSYSKLRMNDIGFWLSKDAKLAIEQIIEQTTNNSLTFLTKIANQLIEDVQKRMEIDTNFENHAKLAMSWAEIFQSTNQTIAEPVDRLMDNLHKLVTALNIESDDVKNFDSIKKHQKKLNVFQLLTENGKDYLSETVRDKFNAIEKQINDFFGPKKTEIQTKITHEIKKISNNLRKELPIMDQHLISALQRRFESKNFHMRNDLLENHCCRSCNFIVSVGDYADQLKAIVHSFNITSINTNQMNDIKRSALRLDELKLLSDSNDNFDMIDFPTQAINYPCSMLDWNHFLIQTYDTLSQYEVQNNTDTYDLSEINVNASKYSPNVYQRAELEKIINVTLILQPQHKCDEKSLVLTITGVFIKTSDIKKYAEKSKCSKIKVFAVDTLFVDDDIQVSENEAENGGAGIYIYAPKWHVVQEKTFTIQALYKPKNFFGWTNRLLNGDLLTVEFDDNTLGNKCRE